MRIIIITQHFPPETGGTPNRMGPMAHALHEAGHEVTVITAKPNHPDGVIAPAFRGGLFRRERWQGVDVIYTSLIPDSRKRFYTRMAAYLSFVTMAVAASFRLRGRCDVVLATSPPLFVGLAGWAVGGLKRARFVFDVRDLWPDLAVALGELGNPTAISLASRLERFLYRKAHAIVTVTHGFAEEIRKKTPGSKPMALIPNGTVPDEFAPLPAARFREVRERLPDGFLVTYAGNLGICQGLDHVVDAAARLQEAGEPVRFLLVGSGPAAEGLRAEAARRGLKNVTFVQRVPKAEAVEMMLVSDLLLVPLARKEIFKTFIPSKLFDSMAAGRPVALAVDGEARRVLEAADGGVYYEAENAEALVEAIRRVRADPAVAREQGARAARFVRERYDRYAHARELERFLTAQVSGLRPETPAARGRVGEAAAP